MGSMRPRSEASTCVLGMDESREIVFGWPSSLGFSGSVTPVGIRTLPVGIRRGSPETQSRGVPGGTPTSRSARATPAPAAKAAPTRRTETLRRTGHPRPTSVTTGEAGSKVGALRDPLLLLDQLLGLLPERILDMVLDHASDDLRPLGRDPEDEGLAELAPEGLLLPRSADGRLHDLAPGLRDRPVSGAAPAAADAGDEAQPRERSEEGEGMPPHEGGGTHVRDEHDLRTSGFLETGEIGLDERPCGLRALARLDELFHHRVRTASCTRERFATSGPLADRAHLSRERTARRVLDPGPCPFRAQSKGPSPDPWAAVPSSTAPGSSSSASPGSSCSLSTPDASGGRTTASSRSSTSRSGSSRSSSASTSPRP